MSAQSEDAEYNLVDADRSSEDASEVMPAYVWLFLAGLTANMFAGNAYLLGLPLGLDRPLFLLAGILLVLDRNTEKLQARPLIAVMGACVLWTTWSWSTTGSLNDSAKAFALADRIVIPFAMFFLGALIFSTARRRRVLLRTLTLIGLYLGVTAVGEILQIRPLVWPNWILDENLGIQFGRARGPFLYSEPMGMTGSLALFSAVALALQERRWWRRIAVLSAVLSVATVVLCLTRTVWLGTIVAVVVVGLMSPQFRRMLPAAAVVLAVAGLGLLIADPQLGSVIQDRLSNQRSVYDRTLTNSAAIRIVDAEALSGIGWGRFVSESSDFVRQADSYPLTNTNIEIHNVFLARAAETGIAGALLWVLAVAFGPLRACFLKPENPEFGAWRLLAIAAMLIWLFPSLLSPNNYPLPNNLIWLICGVASRPKIILGK